MWEPAIGGVSGGLGQGADTCALLPTLAAVTLEALADGVQEESSAHKAAQCWYVLGEPRGVPAGLEVLGVVATPKSPRGS